MHYELAWLMLVIVLLTILFGTYLILMKYHQLFKEVLAIQTSSLRTLINLAVSKDLESFAAIQSLTETSSQSPQQNHLSNFDPNLINDPEMLTAMMDKMVSGEEFGGM